MRRVVYPHLFEIADQHFCPPVVRQQVHAILTFLWSHRIWPFQSQAPYEIVAEVLAKVVQDVQNESEEEKSGDVRIVGFCSGAGGPMPYVERELKCVRCHFAG